MNAPSLWPDLSPARLMDLLRAGGVLPRGEILSVQVGEVLPGGSTVRRLALTYSPDAPPSAPRRLVCKLAAQLDPSRPNLREVEFYLQAAPEMQAGLADPPIIHCFYAGSDPATGITCLLLEDLSETHFGCPPSVLPPNAGQLDGALTALAGLHAFWWDHAGLGAGIGNLPDAHEIEARLEEDARRFADFTVFLGDRFPPAARRPFATVLARLPGALASRLSAARHLTLIHDDPHLGNFLFPRRPVTDSVRLIDWKSWSVFLAPADLAHLMAVFWFPERRARLERATLARYYNRLRRLGVIDYGWADLWRDYCLSVAALMHYPVWQWSAGIPDVIWWPHLNRQVLAFEDLNCAEVLGE